MKEREGCRTCGVELGEDQTGLFCGPDHDPENFPMLTPEGVRLTEVDLQRLVDECDGVKHYTEQLHLAEERQEREDRETMPDSGVRRHAGDPVDEATFYEMPQEEIDEIKRQIDAERAALFGNAGIAVLDKMNRTQRLVVLRQFCNICGASRYDIDDGGGECGHELPPAAVPYGSGQVDNRSRLKGDLCFDGDGDGDGEVACSGNCGKKTWTSPERTYWCADCAGKPGGPLEGIAKTSN